MKQHQSVRAKFNDLLCLRSCWLTIDCKFLINWLLLKLQNIQLREGVFASQIDAQAKEKEGIEGKMAEMAESHILEMKAKADEEEQRINELKEEERLRLEKLQKEKEDEINRFMEIWVGLNLLVNNIS